MGFIPLKQQSETRLKQREKPEEPPPPESPPPQTPQLELVVAKLTVRAPDMPELMNFDGSYIGAVG